MPETNFFWDPDEDNIIQERDETSAITAEYTTEPYLYGNLVSQNRGGVESQYHFDPQGSTLALTDENQQTTDTYAYSAFGEMTEEVGITLNSFRYLGRSGYCKDDRDSSIVVRRRVLQPGIARWLSSDPLLHAEWSNKYLYVVNCPTLLTDPSGLQLKPPGEPHIGWPTTPPIIAQPPAEPPVITDPLEKAALKSCDCKALPTATSTLETSDRYAFVTCRNGKFGLQLNIWRHELPGDYELCGFSECAAKHEQHHIAQFMLMCPNTCKGKGTIYCTFQRNSVWDVQVPAYCVSTLECYGYLVDLECLLDKYKKLNKPPFSDFKRRCLKAGLDEIKDEWKRVTIDYQCGNVIPPKVDKEVHEVLEI